MRVVIPRGARSLAYAAMLAAAGGAGGGCGDPAARVALVNTSGGCGRPAAPTELRVIAYAAGGEAVRAIDPGGAAVDISDFPPDTEQLGVEVVAGGGVVAAVGKTAPLDFLALRDGAAIPIFMAPPEDFCLGASMLEARAQPLVAPTATGVLVVGGTGPGGAQLGTAERYDPPTHTFVRVAVPAVLGQNGFAGAQLTPMPDGRVVLTGGRQPVIAVYDPATDAFGEAKLIVDGRAFHGAIAIDDRHVLTTAGCADVVAGACGGARRADSHSYDVDAPGADNAERTTLSAGRTGATLFDLGLGLGGRRGFVAAGGEPAPGAADPTAADRFALEDAAAAAVSGTFAQPAALDGGGVLTAFAADGAPVPSGAASVIAPGGAAAARPVAAAPALRGVRLVTLEDGRVLGLGGDQPDALRYDPTLDGWQVLPYPVTPARPGPLAAPRLIRLPDGAVLVLGGTLGGAPTAKTWVYRPSLVGPATGAVTVVPAGASRVGVLTPEDPGAVARGASWVIAAPPGAPPGARARALVGGPRAAAGVVRAVVRARGGGVALIAQQQAPGQALLGELTPGAPARILRLAGAEERIACSGAEVAPFDPAVSSTVALAIEGGRATLSRDGTALAACDLSGSVRGAWGVAALGGEVQVDTVTVSRAVAAGR